MQKSKTSLPDVNVWLALALSWHARHERAARWFDSIGDGEAAICRVSQMGLLRLLTQRKVMGADTLSLAEAWSVYDQLFADPRVCYVPEPEGLERDWRSLMGPPHAAYPPWTDRYLLAFARRTGMVLVTLDRVLGAAAGATYLPEAG